jgi:hypothetical protein
MGLLERDRRMTNDEGCVWMNEVGKHMDIIKDYAYPDTWDKYKRLQRKLMEWIEVLNQKIKY